MALPKRRPVRRAIGPPRKTGSPSFKGGKVGSITKLKKSIKSGGGGGGKLTWVPSEGSIVVRFITEPDEWVQYFEHYDGTRPKGFKYFPCMENECEGCLESERYPSKRYLANVVRIDGEQAGKVTAVKIPVTLAEQLLKAYEKYGTLTDRDYELQSEGSGKETTYSALPETPTAMKISRYEPIELTDVLVGMMPGESDLDDSGDEDEEEEERPRPMAKRKARPLPPPKKVVKRRIIKKR